MTPGMAMKSILLYSTSEAINSRGCCRILNVKHTAIIGALYTLNLAILVILVYSWRIATNMKEFQALQDVYYGVQLAYCAVIASQLLMVLFSLALLYGIHKEISGMIVPWIIGFIGCTAFEALSMVYSNVLRDHVNRHFDGLCRSEILFFITRALTNLFALNAVIRFYHSIRSGVTWKKGPEIIEL